MRLTDTDKLKKAMIRYGFRSPDMTVTEFVEDELETIEAEPVKHGHWNFKFTINGQSYRYCSECLEIIYDDTVSKNYCPHCGAKMEDNE